jgi:hypothetical protein
MSDQAKRAKYIYEVFCKLNMRNTVKKRGSVICREFDDYYTPQKAVDNFFDAILKAEEITALERVILVALRELPTRQKNILKERLKEYCLQDDLIGA